MNLSGMRPHEVTKQKKKNESFSIENGRAYTIRMKQYFIFLAKYIFQRKIT